jgi:hypothetical protein
MAHDKGNRLRPLACRDCGFESHQGHACLSLWNVVCCQVEVSAPDRSLVQRSLNEHGACVSLSAVACKNKPLHLQPVGNRGQTEWKKDRKKKEIKTQAHNCSRKSFDKFQKYRICTEVISSETTCTLIMGAKSRNAHQSLRRLSEKIRIFIPCMGPPKHRQFGSFEKYVCEFGFSTHLLAQCGCIKHLKAGRIFMNH